EVGHATRRNSDSDTTAWQECRVSDEGASNRSRGRASDRGGLEPPGRDHGPPGFPPRVQGKRAGGPALGSGGFPNELPARPQSQAGHVGNASVDRQGTTSLATATTGDRPVNASVHVGAQGPDLDRRISENGGTAEHSGQPWLPDPCPHAPPRLRLQ